MRLGSRGLSGWMVVSYFQWFCSSIAESGIDGVPVMGT